MNTIEKIEKLRNNELSDQEIEELKEEIKENNRKPGKRIEVKINKDAQDYYFLNVNKIIEICNSQQEEKFLLYKIVGGQEQYQLIEGNKLNYENLEENKKKFWLDDNKDEYFIIDFDNTENKTTKSIKFGEFYYHLLRLENSPTIDVNEVSPPSEDLKKNEDFQKFISKIQRYDENRMKLENMREYYNDEQINNFLDKMFEVGYIIKSNKFQNTGDDIKDYYYTLSNKFISMLKIKKLKNK